MRLNVQTRIPVHMLIKCLPSGAAQKDKARGRPRTAQIVLIYSGPLEKCCCGLEICLILPGDLLQQRERVGSPPITQVALGRHALGDPPAEHIPVASIHVQQSPCTCSPVYFLHRNPMNLQQALLKLPLSLQGTLHPAAETAALVHISKWHPGRLTSAAQSPKKS